MGKEIIMILFPIAGALIGWRNAPNIKRFAIELIILNVFQIALLTSIK